MRGDAGERRTIAAGRLPRRARRRLIVGGRERWCLAVAAAVACCVPGAAVARRLVNGNNKAGIIAALRRAGELGTPQTSSCLRVYVSTVNSSWATVQFVYTARCEPLDGNGVAVLRHVRRRWQFVTAGSAFPCPFPGHIPRPVQADLRLFCYHR